MNNEKDSHIFNGMDLPGVKIPTGVSDTNADASTNQNTQNTGDKRENQQNVNYFGNSRNNFTPEVLNPSRRNIYQEEKPNITNSLIGERKQEENPALPLNENGLGNPTDMMKDSMNITMLHGGKAHNATTSVSSAVAQGTTQAMNSNMEEYQTVAKTGLKNRAEDMSLILLGGTYLAAFQDSQRFFASALDYSKEKGAIASLEAQGNFIVEQINGLSGVDAVLGKVDYDVETLNKHAGRIYKDTILQNDGKLHMVYNLGGGGSCRVESINLLETIGETKDKKPITGGSLLSEIGEYNEKLTSQNMAIQVLQSSKERGASNAKAWQTLVSGNYQALDRRLHLTDRYNAMVRNRQSNAGQNLKEEFSVDETIRDFCGEEKDIKKLLSAVDENGNSIFSEEELAQLQECITANGFTTIAGGGKLASAAESAKRRWATSIFDEYQKDSISTIAKVKRVTKTGYNLIDSAAGLHLESKANKAEQKVSKLMDKVSKKDDLSPEKIKKAQERLDKMRNKMGADSNKELLEKVKKSKENATKQRATRKQIRNATRGVDRTQARIALNRLRAEDMINKNQAISKKLVNEYNHLEKRLNRQLKKQGAKAAKAAGKASSHIAESKFVKSLGQASSKASELISKAGSFLIKVALPVVGIVLLACTLIVIIIILIVVLFMFAMEFNGNKDSNGVEANDLQIVNEQMYDFEEEQINDLLERTKNTVMDEYDNDTEILAMAPDASMYYDPYVEYHSPVEAVPDYRVYDEYGKESGICNCMQLFSLYRYYYIYMNGDEDEENREELAEDFWIKDFKKGRVEDAWKNTHKVVKYGEWAPNLEDPEINPSAVKKWTSKIYLEDLEMLPLLDMDSFYHPLGTSCDNQTEIVMCPKDVFDEEGNYVDTVWEAKTMCAGHLRPIVTIQVEQDMRNIAKGKKLKSSKGYITWEKFEKAEAVEFLEELLGTYEEDYEKGYTLWADFEVYFGNTKNVLSETQIQYLLDKLQQSYGILSEKQLAIIKTALSGCGKFTYAPGGQNWKEGATGGRVDCSGFVTWVLNNAGMNSSDTYGVSQQYTTTTLSLMNGHTTSFRLANLAPGSILVKGEPGAQSAYGAGNVSTGTGNHTVIWLGYITDDQGKTQGYIIDCTTSPPPGGSSVRPVSDAIGQYQTAIPVDRI